MSSLVGPSPPVTKIISQRENNSLSVSPIAGAITNGPSLLYPQPERKNFARDERQMRVVNVASQKLGAGVEKDCAHARFRKSNVQR